MFDEKLNYQNLLNKMLDSFDVELREVQEKSLNALNKSKNIILLSGCGTGKTEAAYMVSKVWGGKTIYALPMKTLATSIAQRLNVYENRLGSNEQWTLQHSSSINDKFLDNKYSVTTIDQVLSGYFAFGSQAAIRGRNVMMSNLILDEVQLFDVERSLLSTISMLDQTTKMGNNFMLMTATMPQSLMDFFKKRYNAEIVIVDDEIENREVTLSIVDELSVENIENINEKQIVVMNSHNEQIQFYENFKDKERLIVLNNKLLPDDRHSIEQKVFKYFGKGSLPNNKILLSTQVIEAGLDISASYLYTNNCPIDSLIQRSGRISRWGGKGTFTVSKQNTYGVYRNIQILEDTQKVLSMFDLKLFDRQTELSAIEYVLSGFYTRAVNDRRLGSVSPFSKDLKEGSSNALIRNIEQVSIILCNTHNVDDFKRQKISIYTNKLRHLTDTIYILERKTVKEVSWNQVNIGDTIITKPNNWIYDNLGLRYSKKSVSPEFSLTILTLKNKVVQYDDYIEELWIEHALAIKKVMTETLTKDNIIKDELRIERLSDVATLHDIGKLTVNWQTYIGKYKEPLAHAPFKPRSFNIIEGLKHNLIAQVMLKPILTKEEMSLILYHHGRFVLSDTPITLNSFILDNQTNILLNTLGFEDIPLEYGRSKIKKQDTINPANENWGEFVYLLGTLMLSDINAIKYVKEIKTLNEISVDKFIGVL